ncbi:MAG: hypothetical protein H6733_15570 [Alphaproteobacteria bacterium]|nr:hypothetical protein [Alphaproteobacteria bacterium]
MSLALPGPARLGLVALCLATALACGGSDTSAPKEMPDQPKAEAAPAEAPKLADMDPKALEAEADQSYALVPSPVETQAALQAAGIETELATLVPARTVPPGDADTDRVAVRTGVVLADMLLTVETSSNETLVSQLEAIRGGMNTLKGGKDIDATLVDIIDRVKAGSVTRDELLRELDELSNAVIPELEFNGVARIVPLIQAGSWLEGANLVGRAVQAKGQPSAADGILKQPAVVGYFATYAKDKAAKADAPQIVADALDASLARLSAVARKAEPLDASDIETVVSATGSVLSLL